MLKEISIPVGSKIFYNQSRFFIMQNIPGVLIDALKNLGLSGYEARTYAALVLFDAAEAKELVDFLSISKPSVYESLQRLEELGLAVKRNSKPAMFSPVPPENAVKILMESHTKAAGTASRELENLEREKVHRDRSDAIWTVYGDINVERKIRSMLRGAKTSVECLMAGRYLPLFADLTLNTIAVKLLVISDAPDADRKIRKQFSGKYHETTTLSLKKLREHLTCHHPEMPDAAKHLSMENILELIVDGSELLSIPPIPANQLTGLNTSNRAMILHSRVMNEGFWRKLVAESKEKRR